MLLHVNDVQSTCTECMSCYVMLCYAMVVVVVVPCPKNVRAQSDPVSFCASDNKRLVTCKSASSFHQKRSSSAAPRTRRATTPRGTRAGPFYCVCLFVCFFLLLFVFCFVNKCHNVEVSKKLKYI